MKNRNLSRLQTRLRKIIEPHENRFGRPAKLISILNSAKLDSKILREKLSTSSLQKLIEIELKASELPGRRAKQICFVCPLLPHPCEIEIWNEVVLKMGLCGKIITSHQEQRNFKQFVTSFEAGGGKLALECVTLETTTENRTFLAGLDSEIAQADLVVSVGETSLSSYQAMKSRRQLRNRWIVWQTAPRPPQSIVGLRTTNAHLAPQIARDRTIRQEILSSCDVLLAFDKDSATWAYLENVDAQRIRRVSRGLNTKLYSNESNLTRKSELRKFLNIPQNDFIFFQMGPLEIDCGALDTVYAFKNLLQSHPHLISSTKLAFCGTGSASSEIRQAVIDLKLDDQVLFLNQNNSENRQVIGNQLSTLLGVCDAAIHNPVAPVNGSPTRYLDCTYDVLCSLASGVTLVSNGHGWIGEWMNRFYRNFSPSNIHAQAKLMFDSIEKQEKLAGIKRSVRKAIENEHNIDQTVTDIVKIFEGMLKTSLEVDTQDIASLFNQIEKLIQSKQYLEAINLISSAFRIETLTNTQKANLYRYIAESFTRLGDLSSGLQNYCKAYELDPYCAKTHIGLGTIALQGHDYNIAVPQFQKAVSLSPNDDLANLGLGLAFEGLGELSEALKWTARACHLNIENTAAIYNIVKLSYDLNEFVESELILQRYTSLHPNDVNMIYTLGGISYQIGKTDFAKKLMEEILLIDPMNSRAHGLLGQMNRKKELQKQA